MGGAICGGGVAKAPLPPEPRLGKNVCLDAAQQMGFQRDSQLSGHAPRQEFRLIVSPRSEFGRLHGHGDNGIKAKPQRGKPGKIGRDKKPRQIIQKPKAAAIFECLDKIPDGTIITRGDECPLEGRPVAQAVRTDEVGALRQRRLGPAERTRRIAVEGDALQTLRTDVPLLSRGAPAEEAIPGVQQIQQPTKQPPHSAIPKHRRPTPSTPPSRINEMAPRRMNCVRRRSAAANPAEYQRNPLPSGQRV